MISRCGERPRAKLGEPENAGFLGTSVLTTGNERAQWWERAVAAYPPYAEYQQKTSRQIPVFVLEPADGR